MKANNYIFIWTLKPHFKKMNVIALGNKTSNQMAFTLNKGKHKQHFK